MKKITITFTNDAIKEIKSELALNKMCDNISCSDGILTVILMLIKDGYTKAKIDKEVLESIEMNTMK